GTQSNVSICVGVLIHHSPSLANICTKEHLIKWAAIYTIATHKFPKVFRDHERDLSSSPSFNQIRRRYREDARGWTTGSRSFGYDQTAYQTRRHRPGTGYDLS